MRSADQPKYRCHSALPGHHRCCCLRNARVCAGGGSFSQTFVGTTNFAFGRSPSMHGSSWCSRAATARRPGFTTSAPTRLTVPQAHDLVLICAHQPYGRASRRKLQWLRRVAPSCVLSALLVSLAALSVRAHAERCREHPRSGSYDRWSGTECPDLRGSPQIYPDDNWHCVEVYGPNTNYL